MKEYKSFGWYAAKISPHLPKEVFKPVPTRLLGGLAYLAIVITGFLLIGALDLNFWINLAISIVIGFSFAGMGFLGHEILHGCVVRKPWLRDLLGAIAFFPLSTGPSLWRKWHNMNHHVHTQDETKDPDAWPTLEQLLEKPAFIRIVYRLPLFVRAFINFVALSISFTLHSTNMFTMYIKEFQPKNRPKVWFQMVLPWATWISLLFIMGISNWFFAYLLPLFIANFIVMAYISTNHRLNPLGEVNDPLANSLTVTVPKWVDVLHFNFSYHTEHHLFPSMSPKYYPMVKEHLKKMWPERYFEMPLHTALAALWKTPRVYFQEKELVDPLKGHVYGSLGNGLNPKDIQYRKVQEENKLKSKKKATL